MFNSAPGQMFKAIARRLGYQSPHPSPEAQRRDLGAWRDDLYFPEWKTGFITVPKAANTSLKYLILDSLEAKNRTAIYDAIDSVKDKQRIHRALRESPYRCDQARLLKPDVRYILVPVRHPEARLISFYFDKVVGTGWPQTKQSALAELYSFSASTSFEDFVSLIAELPDAECEPHFRSQFDLVGSEVVSDPRLRIIHTESFERDYRAVSEEIGLPPSEGRKENAADRTDFEISPSARAQIRRRYSEDFELFYRTSA
ncbi:sulfotransferase family 2 domain-containing protein [Pseudoroseicyclus sp. CXY001]|uniref:sulfotransferase family 2 domain-containing protein n=1 Tax=Pseudoroseicyclus sp. CXY001 TaxID=3242492 RepID=UPI003570CD5B